MVKFLCIRENEQKKLSNVLTNPLPNHTPLNYLYHQVLSTPATERTPAKHLILVKYRISLALQCFKKMYFTTSSNGSSRVNFLCILVIIYSSYN